MVSRKMAFFDLRDWWLSDERIADALNVTESNPSPFFPFSEPPEANLPYIIYDLEKSIGTANAWWMHTERIYIKIVDSDIDNIFYLANLLTDVASQGADAANDLHRWLISEGRDPDFEYHTIEYIGGRQEKDPAERGGATEYELGFIIDYSPKTGKYIKSD
jgi:hypothetical protein